MVHDLQERRSVISSGMFNKKYLAQRAGLVSCFVGVLMASAASAQSPPGLMKPGDSSGPVDAARPRMGLVVPLTPPRGQAVAKASAKPAGAPSPYQNTKGTAKAQHYYAEVWGVDKLRANYTSSGNLIKFSYRVIQPQLAKSLGDHENTPELVGIRSNAVLHIPTMEKIGQLRQLSAAEADKEYWMVFSNRGNLVKPGDEVSVIIGKFRADGLIVE
jgi:hypothetical protein